MAKFQNVELDLKLSSKVGDCFNIMDRTLEALREGLKEEYTPEEINDICTAYTQEALSGDYDNLIQVTKEYVKCVG